MFPLYESASSSLVTAVLDFASTPPLLEITEDNTVVITENFGSISTISSLTFDPALITISVFTPSIFTAVTPLPSISYIWVPEICGDGLLLGDEKCDDGNIENEDGCSSEC